MLIFFSAECACLTYQSVFSPCQLWSLQMMSDSLVMPFLTSICSSNEYQASLCTLQLPHSSSMPCSCVLSELCTCTDFLEISLTTEPIIWKVELHRGWDYCCCSFFLNVVNGGAQVIKAVRLLSLLIRSMLVTNKWQ